MITVILESLEPVQPVRRVFVFPPQISGINKRSSCVFQAVECQAPSTRHSGWKEVVWRWRGWRWAISRGRGCSSTHGCPWNGGGEWLKQRAVQCCGCGIVMEHFVLFQDPVREVDGEDKHGTIMNSSPSPFCLCEELFLPLLCVLSL